MKLNKVIYNKLILQAEEAKEIGLNKLASAILNSVGPSYREEDISMKLSENVYNNLWKIALDVINYHDLESVDIQKVDEVITSLAENVIDQLEITLDKKDIIGKLEPKLPGQD